MKNKVGLIAGSYDPPTLGHINLIKRASEICNRLYVGIAVNSKKGNPSFPIFERLAMLTEACHDIPNIKIVEIEGLVVEYAKEHKIDFLIRGLRSTADFAMEMPLACANRKLSGIETIFFLGCPEYAHINSTLIREIALGGYRLHGFIPEVIEDAVYTRITMKQELLSSQ